MPAAAHSVYLVEDCVPIRALVAEMLERIPGLRVAGEASEVQEAIDGIRATRPDAVVLDLHLKGGSGIDILRALREDAGHIVFIVLTNHPTVQHERACRQLGARHFLDKSRDFTRVPEILAGLAPAVH